MAKKTKRNADTGEDEEVEIQAEADAEVNEPSQLEPYPTGSPPDPMEEYYKAHPERKLAEDAAAATAAAEEKAAKGAKKAAEGADDPADRPGGRADKKDRR